jgi:hypothetical protein
VNAVDEMLSPERVTCLSGEDPSASNNKSAADRSSPQTIIARPVKAISSQPDCTNVTTLQNENQKRSISTHTLSIVDHKRGTTPFGILEKLRLLNERSHNIAPRGSAP